jgi:hypothetical protein
MYGRKDDRQMKKKKKVVLIITLIVLIFVAAILIFRDHLLYQIPDLSVLVPIKNPTYIEKGPLILFDESHDNFHTANGGYKPFVQLLTADGYRFRSSSEELSEVCLATADVLIIANAIEPLSDSEINAIVEWVKAGKSLLLISDHPPFASPMKGLCKRFGVNLSGAWTSDPAQKEPGARSSTWIRYRRSKGGLGEHPILEGRYPGYSTERINVITSFTGQSIHSETGISLLKLSDQALDYETREQSEKAVGGKSAAGRAQAVAIEFGEGRIVVLAEAGMLTAQVLRFLFFTIERFGFNRPGNDNRQFALNIMHWLTHLI